MTFNFIDRILSGQDFNKETIRGAFREIKEALLGSRRGIAATLVSSDADNALSVGTDDKLYAASGGGSGVQFMSGTENPPTTEPTDTAVGAQYYNTSTKFYWNWNVGTQAWVAVPKVYRALLSQSGTNAPVATVLENSLGGSVVWTRNGIGDYSATLTGAFPSAKTLIFAYADFGDTTTPLVPAFEANTNWVNLHIWNFDASVPVEDGTRVKLEILVYP